MRYLVALWLLCAPVVWLQASEDYGASVGGRQAPDGTELQVDLPGSLHRHNIASLGLGCCVFTSMHHAALWQSVPQWVEFPKWMVDHRIPGGGYPEKVAKLSAKISQDRGMPEPDYVQGQGKDLTPIMLACATGRMVSVTYSFSPTRRYGGQKIAHMVNVVHCDDKWVCVLDNNYPGDTAYEWMTPQEFLRTYTGGSSGWFIVLLDPGPPPAPRN